MKNFFLFSYTVLISFCLIHDQAIAANPWVSHFGLSSADYQKKFNSYKSQGFRLVKIDGYNTSNGVRFAAIWEKKPGPAYVTHHVMTSNQYQQNFNKYKNQGYRPALIDSYVNNNQIYYAAIWEKKSGPAYAVHHGMTSNDFQQKFNQYKSRGYHVYWLSACGKGRQAYFTAIWHKAKIPAYMMHHVMDATDYQNKFTSYARQGYRLVWVNAYSIGSKDYYAAKWEKKSGTGWVAKHLMSPLSFQNEFDNQFYQGYQLTHISGYRSQGKVKYAAIWENTNIWNSADLDHINSTIGAFLTKNKISAAAVAIVKDGKLVFSKGYGVLDPSTGEAVGPNSLFRIASVSKPITGAAVMKQVQEKKFQLGDKVFGRGRILGTEFGSKKYGIRESNITVQNLLEHTAGGSAWNNKNNDNTGDPMFQQTSFNHKELIGWVLDNRNPEVKVGTKYDYSNFGFCILGRIIEKESGMSYENYVRNNVLKPCGITNMYIAADKKEDKRYNEVIYDHSNAYSMPVKRMDAHGGWLASPVDLMRFLVRFDGFNTKPDMLNSTNFTTMVTPSSVNSNYGKGWMINGSNYWHNGSIPGTGAIMVRAGNGMSWAFLMNKTWIGAADSMMWDVVNGIKNWPGIDFF